MPDSTPEKKRGQFRAQTTANEHGSADHQPDVLLDVPLLKVDEIKLEVDNLQAHVSLVAQVLNLLKLQVGADVSLGRVSLDIKGVEAAALLKVRLDNVAAIVDRVMTTIDNNPQILDDLTRGLSQALTELGQGSGEALEEIGAGAGHGVEEAGEGAGAAAESVGADVGDAAGELGRGGQRGGGTAEAKGLRRGANGSDRRVRAGTRQPAARAAPRRPAAIGDRDGSSAEDRPARGQRSPAARRPRRDQRAEEDQPSQADRPRSTGG